MALEASAPDSIAPPTAVTVQSDPAGAVTLRWDAPADPRNPLLCAEEYHHTEVWGARTGLLSAARLLLVVQRPWLHPWRRQCAVHVCDPPGSLWHYWLRTVSITGAKSAYTVVGG